MEQLSLHNKHHFIRALLSSKGATEQLYTGHQISVRSSRVRDTTQSEHATLQRDNMCGHTGHTLAAAER